jgi:hypothetical protein
MNRRRRTVDGDDDEGPLTFVAFEFNVVKETALHMLFN